MSNLLELPNIASKLESQLINVGIETAEELGESEVERRGCVSEWLTHLLVLCDFRP